MSTATREADERNRMSARGPSWMERLMAIGPLERDLLANNPRLRREVRFQAMALVLGPLWFGFAAFRVAINLLGYPVIGAVALAFGAAFSLFTIDQHFLVQARGNMADDVRWSVYKIRAISFLIIGLSFVLMSADTFSEDIDRVLAASRQALRAELERSPRFQAELDAARAAVAQAGAAAGRAEALRARASQLQVDRAKALEEMTNEIQGNVTGNQVRREGYGPKARGYEALAERLRLELEATQQELARLGDVEARMAAAKQQLAAIDQRIEQEAGRAFGGSMQRIEAMIPLLQNSATAWLTIAFWLLVGALPELLMLSAQRRMFNQELFAEVRVAEHEDVRAQIRQLRRAMRQRHTDALIPLEVHLVAVTPQSDAASAAGDPAEATVSKDSSGDRP